MPMQNVLATIWLTLGLNAPHPLVGPVPPLKPVTPPTTAKVQTVTVQPIHYPIPQTPPPVEPPAPVTPPTPTPPPAQCDDATQWVRADNGQCLDKPRASAPVQASEPEYTPKPRRSYGYPNNYEWGNCTWGVANWVDVPDTWGNANTWASRASAMGYTVSSRPIVGSVAQTSRGQYGHVALVIGVNGNSVTIKEVNYQGLGVTSTRTTSASEFRYIYL